jgi:hypothetical protein
MTLKFTTYFDNNYLVKFYTLYQSLEKNCDDFHIYALTLNELDNKDVFKEKKNITFINLHDLETKYHELYYAKKNRSIVEYYFTLTPFICRYVLEKFNLDQITYLDSDIFFFKNPKDLYSFIDECNHDIFITKHDNKKFEKKYGSFNVGWIVFFNTSNSIKCLEDWSNDCINWCFDEINNDKFADQKYLDYWEKNYEKVFILDQYLVNVGPWNIDKINKLNIDNLICYHFHNLNIYYKSFFITNISSFFIFNKLDKKLVRKIYMQYLNSYLENKNFFGDFKTERIRGINFKNKFRRYIKLIISVIKFDIFLVK